MPAHFMDIFPIVTTVFWVWMLIDCLTSKRLHTGGKIGWGLFIFFTQIVGAVIYFFVECKNRNPFDAASYYYRSIKKHVQSSSSTPPYMPHYTPPAQQPLSDYRNYQEGYSAASYQPARQSQPVITPDQLAQPKSAAEQAQYDEPMIQYPEMPM